MSKLSKYKDHIGVDEAARLLARLIGENVSVDDIERLFTGGWISGHYQAVGEIVRLENLLEDELHEAQLEIGNYMVVETDDIVGQCYGVHHPWTEVFLDGRHRILALHDKANNLYGIRDAESKGFYGTEGIDSFLSSPVIRSNSVLEFAVHANNDEPAPVFDYRNLKSANTQCLSEIELYPYYGIEDSDVQLAAIRATPESRPSTLLIISNLLDLLFGSPSNKLNQSAVISKIIDKNAGVRGLSQSSLEKCFSAARQAAKDAKN